MDTRLPKALALILFALMLAACSDAPPPVASPTLAPTVAPTLTPSPSPSPTATPAPRRVFTSGAMPDAIRAQVNDVLAKQPGAFAATHDPNTADLQVAFAPNIDVPTIGQMVYALVAPFPTLVDDVPLSAVQAAWQGQKVECDGCEFTGPLRLTDSTLQAMKVILGEPAQGAVEIVTPDQLTETLWANQNSWGIASFDQLNIRLKTLSIDGRTPIHRDLDLNAYPLVVKLGLAGAIDQAQKFQSAFEKPITNRDEAKMTLVAMTGVTAMSRDFAAGMDQNGVLYPDEKIKDWFLSTDIVHVSNEVSFWQDCPPQPTANRGVFCSDPKYMDLLKDIKTNVIELTGNHLNDYGWEPLSYTLGIYDEAGIPYFGGGRTITEATRYISLTNNGNVIAFAGCNPVGPSIDWVNGLDDGRPGSAPCSSPFPTLQEEISKAAASGAIVFATLQYNEQPLGEYSYETARSQANDFALLADAGAAVVSGSQGHSVQGFGIKGNTFMHYGVGNLFFDQMQAINLRQNFIDRYVVYDNRLINVELLTTIRDVPAQPRPMTPPEKRDLLKTLFALSFWNQ
jgi:poly-gamma-glutamate synthesis protein (capsule biosynthesis protein)